MNAVSGTNALALSDQTSSYALRGGALPSRTKTYILGEASDDLAETQPVSPGKQRLKSLMEEPRQALHRAAQPAKRKSVRADVRAIDGESVQCQIIGMGGQDVTIVLPLAMFPQYQAAPPQIGASFELKMIEEGGYRRPQLTKLPPAPEALADRKARIANIISRF